MWRLCVVLILSCAHVGVVESRPNIVLFVADDLGWNDVRVAIDDEVFHGAEYETPNLERLANESMLLRNYYVQPLCSPTRACLLTGRHPIEAGLYNGVVGEQARQGLPLTFATLPQRLREFGYHTHLVGKWHLGFYDKRFTPTERGFDSFNGYYQGQQDYFMHTSQGVYDFRRNEDVDFGVNGTYSTHVLTDIAVDIINNHDEAEGALFLDLSHQAPHVPSVSNPDIFQPPTEPQYMEPCADIESDQRRQFCAMVQALDESVQNVTNALKDRGMWENTIFIFTSDNGAQITRFSDGGNNAPLRGGKENYFEGGVRGVSFVHGPGLPTHAHNSELLSVCDWYLTLINQAADNAERPRPVGPRGELPPFSHDVWGALSGASRSPREELLHSIDGERRAIRRGDFKLVNGTFDFDFYSVPGLPNANWTYEDGEDELPPNGVRLFNISADPEERNNIAAEHPDIVIELVTQLGLYEQLAQVRLQSQTAFVNESLSAAQEAGGVWTSWLEAEVPAMPQISSIRTRDNSFVTVDFESDVVDPGDEDPLSPPIISFLASARFGSSVFRVVSASSPIEIVIDPPLTEQTDVQILLRARNNIGASEPHRRVVIIGHPSALSTSSIVGIVFGAVCALFLCAMGVYFCRMRSTRRKAVEDGGLLANGNGLEPRPHIVSQGDKNGFTEIQ